MNDNKGSTAWTESLRKAGLSDEVLRSAGVPLPVPPRRSASQVSKRPVTARPAPKIHPVKLSPEVAAPPVVPAELRENAPPPIERAQVRGAARMTAKAGYDSEGRVRWERAILGCLLERPSLWKDASGLTADQFLLSLHQKIFGAIRRLNEAGECADIVSVSAELGEDVEAGDLCGLIENALPENFSGYVRALDASLRDRKFHLLQDQLEKAKTVADRRGLLEEMQAVLAGDGADENRIRQLADVPDVFGFASEKIIYLVDRLIPRGSVVLVTAPPGVGKSWFAMRLAISVSLGTDFLGHHCEKSPVLYCDHENPLCLIRERLEAAAGGSIPGLHYWGSWLPEQAPMIDDPRLLSIAAEEKPLIVFDSLVRFHEGDENSATEMCVVMAHLRRLANAGATVLVIHHAGKGEASSRYRGSSDISAGVDLAMTLSQLDDGMLKLHLFKNRFAPERTFTLQTDLTRGQFVLTQSPESIQRRDDVHQISELIEATPGLSQNQIIKQLGIGRTTAFDLLRKHSGKLWSVEQGANHSRRYFPLSGTAVPGGTAVLLGTSESGGTVFPTPIGGDTGTTHQPPRRPEAPVPLSLEAR